MKPRHENCTIVVSDWPYECIAKNKHPDHIVYVCQDHQCWWHEAPQEKATMTDTERYISKIRNSMKAKYAEAYAVWMVKRGPEPRGRDFGIGEMGAQAVRGRIWQLYRAGAPELR